MTTDQKPMTLFESVTSANPMPTPKKLTADEYMTLPQSEKDQAHTKWLEKKSQAERHNRDSFVWVWQVFNGDWGDCGQGDPKKRHALIVKLKQFKAAIINNRNTAAYLQINWEKYPFPEREEVKNWQD